MPAYFFAFYTYLYTNPQAQTFAAGALPVGWPSQRLSLWPSGSIPQFVPSWVHGWGCCKEGLHMGWKVKSYGMAWLSIHPQATTIHQPNHPAKWQLPSCAANKIFAANLRAKPCHHKDQLFYLLLGQHRKVAWSGGQRNCNWLLFNSFLEKVWRAQIVYQVRSMLLKGSNHYGTPYFQI